MLFLITQQAALMLDHARPLFVAAEERVQSPLPSPSVWVFISLSLCLSVCLSFLSQRHVNDSTSHALVSSRRASPPPFSHHWVSCRPEFLSFSLCFLSLSFLLLSLYPSLSLCLSLSQDIYVFGECQGCWVRKWKSFFSSLSRPQRTDISPVW